MRKSLLTAFVCVLCSVSLLAQTYRNEWIDYNKTYYKFNIGPFGYDIVNAPIKSGVVRIPHASLVSAGLGSVPAEQFQLWRNGEEVPLFVSKTSGILGGSDYIEFWGEINDGKPDKALYRNPANQLSEYWSIQSDTVAYFLTANASGSNKRFATVSNNVTNVQMQAEKNFMFTVGRYFRFDISGGYAAVSTQRLYSSSYDKGEGWTSRPVKPNICNCGQRQLPQYFPQLFADTTGPSMTARLSTVGNALNTRPVLVFLNNDSIVKYQMNYFLDAKINVPNIPANKIKADDATFIVQNLSENPNDELRISKIELEYPRKFNFGNASSFSFKLNASDNGRYIKITNFNTGSALPVLYDITNGKRYVGNTNVADTIQFLLQPSSAEYNLVLVRSDGSTATNINALTTRNFTDYTKSENQGNYLIISNPLIYGSDTSNYVHQYKEYRNSVPGGSFNAKVIDINQLIDQFAYGIKGHPLSIRNFLKFARSSFAVAPEFTFIIGKGVTYNFYKLNERDPLADKLNLVPTWGHPGSDNLLSSDDNTNPIPVTPIGRLSAVSAKEVGDYLVKVKQYEASQQNINPSIAERSWTKNVLQIAGASDAALGSLLDNYLKKYQDIISDTIYGGIVTNFSKTASPEKYPQAVAEFKNIYEKGAGLITYFGHSSSSSLDFSLDNPETYNNTGRYPLFIVNGCLAGNIFDYDINRSVNRSTISEKYVLEPQKGAIGYLSTSSYGVVNYLDIYTSKFMHSISQTAYGKGFGEITKDAITKAITITGVSDFYGRIHGEQYTFHGDPAIKTNSSPKTDYALDSTTITISPNYISVADDSFSVKVLIYNLGRAINDSVHFSLYRKYANGDSSLVYSKQFQSIKSTDSITVQLPIVGNRDKGGIFLTAYIDDNKAISELSETNNIATKVFQVSDKDIRPVYPYNYSIINTNTVLLSASASNPLSEDKKYILELDTTALFNSTLKQTFYKNSSGGLITTNAISLTLDSTVYYWRVAEDVINPHWTAASFTYNSLANQGFEQSHYFQHLQSDSKRIKLDSTRNWRFENKLSNLFIQQSIYPTSGTEENQFSISLNGSYITESACVGSSVIFNVFDTLTFKPLENTTNPFGAGGVCAPNRKYNFEYSTQSAASRKNAMNFLDNIPKGSYVIVRKIYDMGNSDWAPTVWAADTALNGSKNSLYHRLKDQGLLIDSFNRPRTFVFIFKKDDSAHFTPVSHFSQGLYDRISFTKNISTTDTTGTITSPKFGPAKVWNKVKWSGYSPNQDDSLNIEVIGITKSNKDSVLFTLTRKQTDFNISGIDSKDYPYVQLRLRDINTKTGIPFQLQKWTVENQAVAEGAIAPNLGMRIPDTVTFYRSTNVSYDTLAGYVVFKNISGSNFAPLKLKMVLIDTAENQHPFTLPLTRALPAGDTIHVAFNVNVTTLKQGVYNLHLVVNPDFDQPEQYSFNNILYKYVSIIRNTILPVHLTDFNAVPDANNVLLKWEVSNEMNFSHYEVEHSVNGKDFVTIGSVNATSTGNNSKSYTLTHSNPSAGKNYYRLKMVDKTGKFSYSAVRLLVFNASPTVRVFPNPFVDKLNVSVTRTDNSFSTVRVFNYAGQQIIKQTFNGVIQLEVSSLAAGNYMVQVDDGVQVQNFKVQKSK